MGKRKVLGFVALSLLLMCGVAQAGPAELTNGELDGITAGTAENFGSTVGSGGAIVAGNSAATIDSTGTVDLSGAAQAGATGLNIVNSSVSTVANGVNLWAGALGLQPKAIDGAEGGAGFNIEQSNNVVQEQRRQASLNGYTRTEPNVIETTSKTGTTTKDITYAVDTKNYDFKTVKTERSVESTGNLDTTSSVTLGYFKNILGTEIQDFSFGIKGGQGGVAAGAMVYNRPGSSFDLKIENFADIPGKIVFSHVDPEINLNIAGTMCLAQGGSCDGSGKTFDSSEDTVDKSVFETKSGTENSTDTYTSESMRTVYAPVSVQDARAEYIVADGSSLDVKTVNGIYLSGTAQQNMKGLNVVNAAGSAVANGVNIARTTSADLSSGGGRILNLTQSNIIIHNR